MNPKKYYVPIKGVSFVKFRYKTYLVVSANNEDEAVQKALEIKGEDIKDHVAHVDFLEYGSMRRGFGIREEIILSMQEGKFIVDEESDVAVPVDDEDDDLPSEKVS